MSAKIPRSFIDDLLTRVDIVELIDTHVPLKKTGSSFVARCPFHTEKSPSFSVNRHKQFFHCFGCGAGGNAISFLMDFSHLDFVEAVTDLAAFAGIPVPTEASGVDAGVNQHELIDKQVSYDLLQQVAAFYAEQLRVSVSAKKAVTYLRQRGISGEFAKRFQLGYADEAWQVLEQRFPKAALQAAGLLIVNDEGKSYDRFRGRLMFPIRDKRARVLGFGARVLDDSLPKYLNSPETPVFQKGREAYGLFEVLQKNARPSRILIVEGYLDVISLAQAGIDYAVATLGTATSKAHLDLLYRYTGEIVLCFDGDKAGQQAAWRAMDVVFASLREGRQVRVMLLPQGEDPDSLVRQEGLAGVTSRIDAAQTLSVYFFEQLTSSANLSGIEGRAQLVETAMPYLNKLPQGVYREMMFERLKELSGGIVPGASQAQLMPPLTQNNAQLKEKLRLSTARTVIALLLQNPYLISVVIERQIEWEALTLPSLTLLRKVVDAIVAANRLSVNTASIIECFRNTPDYKAIVALASIDIIAQESEFETIFANGLDGLLQQAFEFRDAMLIEKARVSQLTPAEKEMFKKIGTKQIR